jgi:hypothetical protein
MPIIKNTIEINTYICDYCGYQYTNNDLEDNAPDDNGLYLYQVTRGSEIIVLCPDDCRDNFINDYIEMKFFKIIHNGYD